MPSTVTCYRLMLAVHTLVLASELLVCQLTHSLIILTDSYINLYTIMQISTLAWHSSKNERAKADRLHKRNIGYKILGRHTTFELDRLPLIGAFINGLFLAALLMSVAIEGIQTCFHADHLWTADEQSMGTRDHRTYPAILAALALVDALMQYWARLVRNQAANERLLCAAADSELPPTFVELSASSLSSQRADCRASLRLLPANSEVLAAHLRRGSTSTASCQPVALMSIVKATRDGSTIEFRETHAGTALPTSKRIEWHELLRSYCSPAALFACCAMVVIFRHETVTEVSDASLAISIVVLMFAGLKPPIEAAGRVLMQATPDKVDVRAAQAQIEREHPAVLAIRELHVWSLDGQNSAIGTCHLLVNSNLVRSSRTLDKLLKEVQLVLAKHNVEHVTIQLDFGQPDEQQLTTLGASETSGVHRCAELCTSSCSELVTSQKLANHSHHCH